MGYLPGLLPGGGAMPGIPWKSLGTIINMWLEGLGH